MKNAERMTYTIFSRLWTDVDSVSNIDLYVTERGRQGWMDAYDDDAGTVVSILTSIYRMRKDGMRGILSTFGGSCTGFCNQYAIPRRSMDNWLRGINTPPTYLPKLLAFAVLCDRIPGGEK